MELTSKQRATLRGYANKMETILQVGKGGVIDTLVKQADDALTAREMIKIGVLDTAPQSAKEVAFELAPLVNAQIVQVIGSKIVLYRQDKKDPKFKIK